jgi:hypothetical protein
VLDIVVVVVSVDVLVSYLDDEVLQARGNPPFCYLLVVHKESLVIAETKPFLDRDLDFSFFVYELLLVECFFLDLLFLLLLVI